MYPSDSIADTESRKPLSTTKQSPGFNKFINPSSFKTSIIILASFKCAVYTPKKSTMNPSVVQTVKGY